MVDERERNGNDGDNQGSASGDRRVVFAVNYSIGFMTARAFCEELSAPTDFGRGVGDLAVGGIGRRATDRRRAMSIAKSDAGPLRCEGFVTQQ
jgi:hypothetical protein